MRKSKVFFITVLVCFLSMSLLGCKDVEENVCTEENVTDLMQQYLTGDYSVCTDTVLQLNYNNMSELEQQEASLILKNVKVENVTKNTENSFTIELYVPDIGTLLNDAVNDTGFLSDYQDADLQEDPDEYKVSVVRQYLIALLQQGSFNNVTKTITIEISGEETYKIVTDLPMWQVVKELMDYTECTESVQSTEVSDANTNASSETLSVVDSDGSFMFQQNGARLLAYDIRIESGDVALNSIKALSAANSDISSNDTVYFIQYKVRNLSNFETKVTDCFCMVEDGLVLENSGTYVSGITSVSNLGVGEVVELSSLLVGSDSSKVVWYSTDTLGSYEINIVQ